jgi:abortive infection bacteriophage resistance protein
MKTPSWPYTLRAKTRQEIAEEYGIDRKTLYRWLRKLNIDLPKGLIFPNFQDVIYKELGRPPFVQDDFRQI